MQAATDRLTAMVDPAHMPPAGFDKLSVEEQIDYVQWLWDRIAARADGVPVPEWHVRELRSRANAPQGLATWDEVRAHPEAPRSRQLSTHG